jgi:hypothetical protein
MKAIDFHGNHDPIALEKIEPIHWRSIYYSGSDFCSPTIILSDLGCSITDVSVALIPFLSPAIQR